MKLFKLTITAIIAVILTLTYSCQQESLIEQDYSDMPYLSLPESTDFNNLSQSEMQTIMDAFERMGIHEDNDGLLQLKPRSGWEVNVSENIYQFFFKLIDNSNQTILLDIINHNNNHISRSEGFGDNPTNCLADAISRAFNKPQPEVDVYLMQTYGNQGVPSGMAEEAILHFGNFEKKNPNDIGAWNTMGDQYIIIIQEGGYLHAVNGIDKFGDNSFRYNDYQNNRQGIVLDHNVVGIYKVFRN